MEQYLAFGNFSNKRFTFKIEMIIIEEGGKIMQTIKKMFGVSLMTSIVFLIFGLFLIFKTEGTIQLISGIIGFILLVNGGLSLIRYFKDGDFATKADLISGIVTIVAGLVMILNPKTIVSILPFVLGIYFIITGVVKLKYAIDIYSYKKENPIFMMILSILTIICGILFIANPFSGAVAITQLVGIFMSIYACLDIANYFVLKKDIQIIEKIIK